jgi:hypothetical protein
MPKTRRPRSRRRPALEGLEARDVPTVLPGWGLPAHRPGATLTGAQQTPTLTMPGGVPTPHEQARQRFDARFSGPLRIGPGRTSAQSSVVYLRAGGTSNAFFRGSVLIGLSIPADPGLPVTGVAAVFPSNASATGSTLVLDLTAPRPADGTPPAQLSWTVDGASAGLWAGAVGSGTLTLLFRRGHTAGAVFEGTIVTTGVTNLLNAAHISPQ